jgi:hypothetical protein
MGDVAGRTWNSQMAVALLEERAIEPNDMAVSEVDRYLGLPGQAISYKVGERVWLEARQDARRRLGTAFDLKAWHAHALAISAPWDSIPSPRRWPPSPVEGPVARASGLVERDGPDVIGPDVIGPDVI